MRIIVILLHSCCGQSFVSNYLREPKLNHTRQINSWSYENVEGPEDSHITSSGEIEPSFFQFGEGGHTKAIRGRGLTEVTVCMYVQ